MYDPKSMKAGEFIDHGEVMATLAYAERNSANADLVGGIIEKARLRKGLSHREAAVLLDCSLEDRNREILDLARQIKQDFYGNRIVMFAPLYLSNYCINSCLYCPYHRQNGTIPRRKLSQGDIAREVAALQDMGHKRLAIEAGEHPEHNPIEYILESIRTIYSIKHRNGAIRRVNVNIAATTADNYRKLRDAGIGTYILFQETYHREGYERLHPAGPKHDYAWHTEAMDRAMGGGIDDVGVGVLFGLERYRYEFAALLMHAEHLEAAHGVGPHTISVPRVRAADGIDPGAFGNGISDSTFAKIVACARVAVPYTGIIVSTRESMASRERVLGLGVSQISGGSRTSVGGYVEPGGHVEPEGAEPGTAAERAKPGTAPGRAERAFGAAGSQPGGDSPHGAAGEPPDENGLRGDGAGSGGAGNLGAAAGAHGGSMAPGAGMAAQSGRRAAKGGSGSVPEGGAMPEGGAPAAEAGSGGVPAGTGVAGAAAQSDGTEQFSVNDSRTLDEVVVWLMRLGYIPSFCTACYREGRTGDRFMALCKSGQIQNCCHPNALMTLKEYLMDYAGPEARQLGERLIESELGNIPKEKVRALVSGHLEMIGRGSRDFRL
ncbi:MAG: [FeFe] hydrogenase H-cluster radical SAM maturase HydG [Clostridiales bacterium]|jgi:2-iminoacetate synthase|nr:[FeFe] hydrogenase H-cluster radical SAM maturase HydG [Clostridiales bacterium]